MPDPFTIRIFVPNGDPHGVRLIDRMNWTGVGIVFPRTKWSDARIRLELQRTGVYILVGSAEEDSNLPTLYIGQGDGVRNRIDSHVQSKDFWDWGIVFVSSSGGLNRAHVTWLEYALISRVNETNQCVLNNANSPQEPALMEAEKADTKGFLNEILQILPLVGLRAFEFPETVAVPAALDSGTSSPLIRGGLDTVVVPAQKEGFEQVFLGEDCWYAIRISGVIGAPAANASDIEVRWDIVDVVDFSLFVKGNVNPGGEASALAEDGSKITLTGSGTFKVDDEPDDDVTGGGTWTIDGGPNPGSGTYEVTNFVSFHQPPGTLPFFLTDNIGNRAVAASGLVHLTIEYSDGSQGVLVVACRFPDSPGNIMGGITASKDDVNYWDRLEAVPPLNQNLTIFHILSDGDSDDE